MTFEWTAWPGAGPGLDILGDLTGRRIVEFGCSDGANAAAIGIAGGQVIGLDHDLARIDAARTQWGHLAGLTFVCAEATRWLADQHNLDIAISVFGALSFSPAAPLLQATAMALRPGGLLAFSTHLPPTDRAGRTNGQTRGWLPHARHPSGWASLIAQQGLELRSQMAVDRRPDSGLGWPCQVIVATSKESRSSRTRTGLG